MADVGIGQPSRHVLCVKTVEDASGRYCLEGKTYEVKLWDEKANWMIVLAEGNVRLYKNFDDNCFQHVD